MAEQNIAQQYYQDEHERTKKSRPWVYWVVLGVVVVAAIVAMMLA